MLAREMLTADLTPAQEALREALLGVLPAALAFWGAFYSLIRWHDRRDRHDRLGEDLTRRMDALERREVEQAVRRVGSR
jgi:hypothetical protein